MCPNHSARGVTHKLCCHQAVYSFCFDLSDKTAWNLKMMQKKKGVEESLRVDGRWMWAGDKRYGSRRQQSTVCVSHLGDDDVSRTRNKREEKSDWKNQSHLMFVRWTISSYWHCSSGWRPRSFAEFGKVWFDLNLSVPETTAPLEQPTALASTFTCGLQSYRSYSIKRESGCVLSARREKKNDDVVPSHLDGNITCHSTLWLMVR